MIGFLSEPRAASAPPPFESGRAPRPAAAAPFAPRNRNLAFLLRRDEHASDVGVQLPLLAPMLAGLRLRSAPTGPEFILPNPSGGRGVYVTSWPVVTGFATPSLHDTLLIGRLSGQKRVDPQAVREAARWVAREGHAGPEAANAARDVEDGLRTASLRLGGQLLMALARCAGFNTPEAAARCLSRSGFFQLAGRLGWHGPELAEALRGVSARFASVAAGYPTEGALATESGDWPPRTGSGRWGRIAALLGRLRTSLAEEQSNGHGTDGTAIGRIIAAADHSLGSVNRLLSGFDALHANPLPLLESWRDNQNGMADWLGELDATLDGWARVCLLWFDRDTAARRQAVIAEMAVLTRTVGNGESRGQGDISSNPAEHSRILLLRNERLRARELLLDVGGA